VFAALEAGAADQLEQAEFGRDGQSTQRPTTTARCPAVESKQA